MKNCISDLSWHSFF